MRRRNRPAQDSSNKTPDRRQMGQRRQRQNLRHDSTRPPAKSSPTWPRPTRPTSTRPSRRPGGRLKAGPWQQMSAAERGRLLNRLADLIEEQQRGTGGPRNAQQRQTDQRFLERRLAADHRLLPLLRRLDRQNSRQDDPGQRAVFLLHAARAGRRRRADHPLELSAVDAGVEAGSGAGVRLHRRDEAGRADAALGASRGRADLGGRFSARRREPAAGLRTDRRPGHLAAPGNRQGGLHRLDRSRPPDHGGRRADQPQAGDARAGRQEPEHRLCRHRSRRGRAGLALRPVLQPGAVLLRREPAVRRAVDPRKVRRQDRWPSPRTARWATRSIRPPSKGRRSPTSSSRK